MKKEVLILIDIQCGFAEGVWGIRNNDSFEGNVAALLALWRRLERQVIHVRHNSTSPTSPLHPHDRGNEFAPCAKPLPGETIIPKTVNNAFIGTGLANVLGNPDTKRLTFVGLTTDHCVSTSVRMAANLGFECVVAADATATFPRTGSNGARFEADLIHETALASLQGEFARIARTQTLITTTMAPTAPND